MKNKVIRNFLIFVIFWLLITLGMNVFNQRPLFHSFPWEVLLIFLLSLIQIVTNYQRKIIWSIYFVVFFIFMLLTGGYYNWTSLITFVMMSVFMSAITYFIGNQFKKGEHIK
jgi:hypothetical protein